jgi:Glycosyltransferase family 87/WD40-like Beta Propeller Repeat
MTIRVVALLTFAIFLLTAFRAGWMRAETDFPNYYTGAVLVRHGQPLRNFYDWTWFQRQMNYAGIERQLGAYAAQTPLTMLPMVPLASLPVQNAKRVWLICNLVFLAVTIWLLSRVTRFSMEQIWLLAFCGYSSLYTNFSYGQYYVFLLFLLTASFYSLFRRRDAAGGFIAGCAFALKLYGGPFLLLFLAKRKWKAVAGMIVAMVLFGLLAIKLFGWSDIHYYVTQVLPRSLDGNSIDPYAPGSPTLSNMLHNFFLKEPELNPHPLWNSPPLFFFLRSLATLAIAAVVALGVATRPSTDRRDFAWFVVATLLLSTSTGSYTYIVLLLPLVLLLEESNGWQSALFIVCYILLTMPVHFARFFPKVWVLMVMFVAVRWDNRRELRRPLLGILAALIVFVAWVNTKVQMASYAKEPGQRFERVAMEPDANFSSFPVITRAGLFYESMGRDRYVLRWLHDGRDETLSFDGHAFRPSAHGQDGSIVFELVAHGTSTIMLFDPARRVAIPTHAPVHLKDAASAVSPDGKWVAFTSDKTGTEQVWRQNVQTGGQQVLTGGKCNSSSPAWELDSKAIIFTSDCGRALGLPALYRAPVR